MTIFLHDATIRFSQHSSLSGLIVDGPSLLCDCINVNVETCLNTTLCQDIGVQGSSLWRDYNDFTVKTLFLHSAFL